VGIDAARLPPSRADCNAVAVIPATISPIERPSEWRIGAKLDLSVTWDAAG